MPHDTMSTSSTEDDNTTTADQAHTPRKHGPAKSTEDGTATTPKSAPDAGIGARPRKQDPPTLLTDFFLGRPSPARLAAERQRRQSVDAVKAELRHEMRANAVRKVQPPGGVRDRVKSWQKANAAVVVADGVADDAATEPTDIAFKGEDIESVTEEDRVRIKFRQRKKPAAKAARHVSSKSAGNVPTWDELIANEQPRPVSPPKKRVVSDHNWMKDRPRKSPTRKVSPLHKKSTSPTRLPKDFTLRTQNPKVSSKVQQWAAMVEQPDPQPPRSRQFSNSHKAARAARSSSRPKQDVDSQTGRSEEASGVSQPSGDDGIRVKPVKTKPLDDDGIRVRPMGRSAGEDKGKKRETGRGRAKHGDSAISRNDSDDKDEIIVIEDPSELSTAKSTEISESQVSTPTRRGARRKSRPPVARRPKSELTGISTETGESWASDDDSRLEGSHLPLSDLGSSLTAKTLADIPGDIPWGHSAFTELDLPLNGPARSRPKRTKMERNTSYKGVNGVFKKVVEEGKKLMQDMNEPPRPPPANKPPSIETWLNTTVDPFVEKEEATESPEVATPEKGVNCIKTRPSHAARKTSQSTSKISVPETEETVTELTETTTSSLPTVEPKTPEAPKESKQPSDAKTPTSSGLKRRSATRNTFSPLKGISKAPIFGILKEAFQGESKGHTSYPKVYQTVEERKQYSEYDDDDYSTEFTSTILTDYTATTSELQEDALKKTMTPAALATPRLRPPTKGHHELSTIMSEGSSTLSSDLSSDASYSTVTQSTILTGDSDPARAPAVGGGLKRRLTKHSDLVSALSLPDEGSVPDTIKSRRSRPSLRKTRGTGGDVTVDDLLREFADDESLYLRELKTLVDGVIPVLLTQVVDKGDLFAADNPDFKSSGVSKSVIGMGVALEKLRMAHRKAPVHDIRRLSHWANGVVPTYHSYLSAWRLGFQDLFVNLAPRGNELDDEDSLIGALPRNANGDIVDAQGERVDVAYLLKRPLLRLKQMTKFIKCVDSMMPSHETAELLRDFEDLQDKARRRHREETARLADEEAAGTDTTRCRDIRTLTAIDQIYVDQQRQVSAKDLFSLDLVHSNGQRMECQVELVHRDRPNHPEDEGDLLIRETGDARRSYLLFPPIRMSNISARTGEGNFDMVIMIRGTDAGGSWHELITLTADDEDQILDWLDILPVSPVPPREPEPSVIGDPDDEPAAIAVTRLPDAPVGVPGFRSTSQRAPESPLSRNPAITPTKRPLPSRYHPRSPGPPRTPTQPQSPLSPRSEKTPTQDDYRERVRYEQSLPLRESMRPDPAAFQTPQAEPPAYREDGAPSPPAHRSQSPSPGLHSPARDTKKSPQVRRRTSSPLKHEYNPSDRSASELSATGEESGSESSDDEIDSLDIPETELGISLQKPVAPGAIPGLTESDCSLTPSNSASQAGLHGPKAVEESAPRYLASVSRWSDKGAWKDIASQPCSLVVTAGLIEAYALRAHGNEVQADARPLLALDLTPLVLCRQSTTVDLEIRSSVQPHCRAAQNYGGGNFRFRCHTGPDCFNLYMSVHHARLNNQKFIQLENEARFKSFGERRAPIGGNNDDASSSSRRRSWFGRKNSYRGSTRAPSQDGASQTPSSNASASSFLKRLTVAGNLSFNLARSSIDTRHRGGSGGNSLYGSSSSEGTGTPPRSPSISTGNAGLPVNLGSENLRIRLHLLTTGNRWEDMGNCSLTISRPPPGWRQALRANHGLEKRVTIKSIPRNKDKEEPATRLDAVLGSGCFSSLGTRGIVCGVWEELKSVDGVVGAVPATGTTGGNVQRWCFQFASAAEAQWVLRLVHQEVDRTA